MKSKIKIIYAIALIAIGSIVFIEFSSSAGAYTVGSPFYTAGGPADFFSNCTHCHGGGAETQAGLITSTIPSTGYVPGETYEITASITTSGVTKYGFQLSAQTDTGALVGSIIITDPANTQLFTNDKYINHTSAGTSFPSGTATWSFSWIAPPAGTGDLTFYGAFNSSDNNNSNAGDSITLSTLTVFENASTGISIAKEESAEILVYPNPFANQLFVKNNLNTAEQMNVTIIDIKGRVVKTINALKSNQSIDLKELATGNYTIKIKTSNGVVIKKTIKK